MLDKFIDVAMHRKGLTLFLFLALCVMGWFSYKKLALEAYPDISDTNVIIITQYDGRAAEEVEQQITIPIERALFNVPNVVDRRSRTLFGLSVVQLTFADGTLDFFARQSVAEKLQTAEIPEGVTPELGPLTSPTGEVFRYFLEFDYRSTPMDIRTLNEWTIKPRLLQVPGVADVSIFGGPAKQFQVLTSPPLLRKYGLSIKDIIQTLEENNLNTGGNIIVRGSQGMTVRGAGAILSLDDIKRIVVASYQGTPIFLSQVASIEIGPPYPSGILGYNIPDSAIDVGNSTEGIVLLKRGEDPNTVLTAVNETINEIRSKLPAGVSIHILYDRSWLVEHTLSTVSHTIFEGIGIVVLVLIIFLGSWRTALVVAATIPFSLLFSFILLRISGVPANLLSLGAIDFGIIVDGACVMAVQLVNLIRTRRDNADETPFDDFLIVKSKHIGHEVFMAVLIIICSYLPLFLLERVEGKLFRPMAFTLAYAILGSLLSALTVVPILIGMMFKNKTSSKRNISERMTDWFEVRYAAFLHHLLKIPFLGTGLIVLSLTGVFILAKNTGVEFLPPLDEGSIFFRSNLPSGVAIYESAAMAPKIRKIISRYPQVKSVFTQTGRNDDGTDPFGPNRTEVLIDLKDYSLWTDTISKVELQAKMKVELENAFPGAYFSFGQPIIDQVMEIVNGSAAHLAVTLAGDTLEHTRQAATVLAKGIAQIPGASEVGLEQEGPQDQIKVQIDREKTARFGINISEIQLMIEAAIGGKVVGNIYEGAKRFDLMVRFLPQHRNRLEDIQNLTIKSSTGQYIPLRELATIVLIEGQTIIYRAEGKRIITIKSNIVGRDQQGFADEVTALIEKSGLAGRYEIKMGGQFENLQRAGKQLMVVVPLTIMLIFILLYLLYGTISDVVINMLSLPVGILGGLGFLMLRGYHFNISAGVGFISLFGVTIMAGVIMVSAFRNASLIKGDDKSLVKIAKDQLMPVVLMMVVALLGLIPAARSQGIGSDIQRPLATVILGGLIASLAVLPLLYPLIYSDWLRLRRIKETD